MGLRFHRGSSFSKWVFVFVGVFVFEMGLRFRRGVLRLRFRGLRFRNYPIMIPHGDSESFSLSHARDKAKNIFLFFFTELKT